MYSIPPLTVERAEMRQEMQCQFESFTNSITSAIKSVQAELIELRNQPSSELEMRMIPSEDALSVDADIEVFETAAVKPVKPWDGPPSRGDMP